MRCPRFRVKPEHERKPLKTIVKSLIGVEGGSRGEDRNASMRATKVLVSYGDQTKL